MTSDQIKNIVIGLQTMSSSWERSEEASVLLSEAATMINRLVCGLAHQVNTSRVKRARWSLVSIATGYGSSTAAAICVAGGTDPDEMV